MSYAMKVARRGRYGDPGLFGVLGGVIKTVTGVAGSVLPGPLGTVAKGISNVLPGKNIFAGAQPANVPFANLPAGPLTFPGAPPTIAMPGAGLAIPVPASAGGTVPMTASGPKGCQVGYHPNKSGYWSNKNKLLPGASWTPAGSACVKRRRMNPLNPRAISRAIRRLESAKRATSRLSRVSIRGGCGCK